MYLLEEKIYFYLLAVIPVLAVSYALLYVWKLRKRRAFADSPMLKKLAPNVSFTKPLLKLLFVAAFFVALSVALVNPKIGTKVETVKREGIDVVFAIDVSKSMDAEDIAPSRLSKAKRIVFEALSQLTGDRVGIIVYAAQAYPLLPITTDYSTAGLFLQNADTDMLSSQGTAIDEAVKMASGFYDDEERTNRVLFILSDGEDHSEKATQSIEQAKSKGIKVYTIGIGTPSGGPIPIKQNGINTSYKRDNKGEVVITKLNEDVLKTIAQAANGAYFNGADTAKTKDFIASALQSTDKNQYESKEFSEYKSQFQWFLAIALLFLMSDTLMFEGKTAWLSRFNLFNESNKKDV